MSDDKLDRYLFDPDEPPAEEVEEIERMLAPLRFDPEAHRLAVPVRRRQRRFRALLVAAAMLIAIVTGAGLWLWTWPTERPWTVVAGSVDSLPVGTTVDANDPLLIRVARIGWMRVAEGSVLTLLSTRSNHHRLAVEEGTVHVSVWAPPRSVALTTPAGEVIDFGCEFVLRVGPDVTSVDVVSGWVQLDNAAGEVLVPGGASSSMTRSGLPSVPLFRSAAPEFREAIQTLDGGSGSRDDALQTALRAARRRDVLSLLLLASRDVPERDALLVRAAELMPPRSQQTLATARQGDDEAIMAWIEQLPLPPVKSWVPNWRDRLPPWLR